MIKRIISSLILASFLFTTVISDLAFAQSLIHHPNSDKLAAASICDDIIGIEHKDVHEIALWFTACLRYIHGKGFKTNIENLQKFNKPQNLPGRTIFQMPEAKFLIQEVKENSDGSGFIVKVKRQDNVYGARTYFAEFSNEHNGTIDVYPKGRSKERTKEDTTAIDRYVAHEKGIDTVIRYAHEEGLAKEPLPERLNYREAILKLTKDLKIEIANPDNLIPIEDRKFFLIPLTREIDEMVDGLPLAETILKSGAVIKTDYSAHSSNNRVHAFITERDFAVLTEKKPEFQKKALPVPYREMLRAGLAATRAYLNNKLAHEIGVMTDSKEEMSVAGDAPKRIFPPNEIDVRWARIKRGEHWFVDTLQVKLVNLDTNLLTRDYAAGDRPAQQDARDATLAGYFAETRFLINKKGIPQDMQLLVRQGKDTYVVMFFYASVALRNRKGHWENRALYNIYVKENPVPGVRYVMNAYDYEGQVKLAFDTQTAKLSHYLATDIGDNHKKQFPWIEALLKKWVDTNADKLLDESKDPAKQSVSALLRAGLTDTLVTQAKPIVMMADEDAGSRNERINPPSILEAAEFNIREAAERMEFDPELLEIILKPKKVTDVKFKIRLENGEMATFWAFRALQNDALGPGKGGIRWLIGKDETLEEAKKTAVGLATFMTVKNSVIGIPYGGGKGDVFVEARDYTDDDKVRIMRAFSRGLTEQNAIGTFIDVPAPDKGTDARMMAWFLDEHLAVLADTGRIQDKYIEEALKKVIPWAQVPQETSYLNMYMKLLNDDKDGVLQGYEIGMVTGKPIGKGGSEGRTKATGFGGFLALKYMLNHFVSLKDLDNDVIGKTLNDKVKTLLKTKNLSEMTAAIQGTGNVGEYNAWELYRADTKILILQDAVRENGQFIQYTLHNLGGIDIELLNKNLKRLPDGRWAPLKTLPEEFFKGTGYELLRGDEEFFWETHTNIKVPAATENVITNANAGRVNCEIILELANDPTTPNADRILNERGILVIPDILANAGGVTVSYYEWLQNIEGIYHTEPVIDKMLEERINIEARTVLAFARKYGVGLRKAAYRLSLARVGDAVIAASDELTKKFSEKNPYKYYGELGLFPATLKELNRIVIDKEKLDRLIAESEAVKSLEMDAIVDEAIKRLPQGETNFILITGRNTSGKLGFAINVVDKLRAKSRRAIRLNYDELKPEDLRKLRDGEEIDMVDYVDGQKIVHRIKPKKGDIFIAEGKYALSNEALNTIPEKNRYEIWVNAVPSMILEDNYPLTSLNLRLLRHILTVYHTEGKKAIEVIRQWPAEIKEQIERIDPTWVKADVTFNGYLPYELPVLKFYVKDLIKEASEVAKHDNDKRSMKIMERLERTLKGVIDIEAPDTIPANSISQQYTGKKGFYDRLIEDAKAADKGAETGIAPWRYFAPTLFSENGIPSLIQLLVQQGSDTHVVMLSFEDASWRDYFRSSSDKINVTCDLYIWKNPDQSKAYTPVGTDYQGEITLALDGKTARLQIKPTIDISAMCEVDFPWLRDFLTTWVKSNAGQPFNKNNMLLKGEIAEATITQMQQILAGTDEPNLEEILKLVPEEWLDGWLDLAKVAEAVKETGREQNIISSDDKSALIFSEKATFGEYNDGNYEEGIGFLLPSFVKSGVKVAVVAVTEKQRALIDKLNKEKPEDKRIIYDNSVAEVSVRIPAARYYYFKVAGEADAGINGITNITIIVKRIIDAIGKVMNITRTELIQQMHDAAQKFAMAA